MLHQLKPFSLFTLPESFIYDTVQKKRLNWMTWPKTSRNIGQSNPETTLLIQTVIKCGSDMKCDILRQATEDLHATNTRIKKCSIIIIISLNRRIIGYGTKKNEKQLFCLKRTVGVNILFSVTTQSFAC